MNMHTVVRNHFGYAGYQWEDNLTSFLYFMKMEMNFDSIQQGALCKTLVILYLFLRQLPTRRG